MIKCDRIVSNAQSAKEALLRGREIEVSANLGQINNHLEIASELGVGPTLTPREGSTAGSASVSPVNYHSSPNVPTAQGATSSTSASVSGSGSASGQSTPAISQTVPHLAPLSTLLPSLPVENSPDSMRFVSPTGPQAGGPNFTVTPAQQQGQAPPSNSADYASTTPILAQGAPPLTHSHSYPNVHQLPSQLHGITSPSTPVVPSPSFTTSLGVTHMPIVSSPLATMPVSRAPSPPRPYPIPEMPWGEMSMPDMGCRGETSDGSSGRRPSDGRLDGRPVINRSRSASVNKPWSSLTNMTAAAPPSAWQSRQGSPEDGDDDDSEEEGPRKTKRRRSSAGKDDVPDLGSQSGPVISEDIRRQLDQIFEEFLNRVCSDCELFLQARVIGVDSGRVADGCTSGDYRW